MLKFIEHIFRRKARIVSVSHTDRATYAAMSDGRVFCRAKNGVGEWVEPAIYGELQGE
ncbi:hypothetical protein [Gluconobacter wancherniae]|uniref:hypothetical protein n=1 Tax=Gluconobacter wancherniae TaxID=1307955 RepID=UPI001B8C8072|nr:hypothetical protein [Gluconobacter wancherniae]MBS1088158.1 hypothetical protein [Gluconobacter wancherniae]